MWSTVKKMSMIRVTTQIIELLKSIGHWHLACEMDNFYIKNENRYNFIIIEILHFVEWKLPIFYFIFCVNPVI